MSQRIKVGITGIGGYGRLLLDILLGEQRKGDADLQAAVVSLPEQDAEHLAHLRAQSPKTRIFSSLDEAASSGVELDLMVLPVGIAAHKELTLKSLAAGWNVLVEKPLAGSVADAETIIAADESSDRFVAVGYQDMYGSDAPAMKRALLSGAIGEVRSVRVAGMWGRPVNYYRRNRWAGRLLCDGMPVYDSPFNNAMAHYLNQALYLAGPDMATVAAPVSVEGSMWRAHEIESCDTAVLRWQTRSGPEIGIFFSHTGCEQQGPEMIIEGTNGSLFWKLKSHWELRPLGGEPVRWPAGPVEQMSIEKMKRALRRIQDAEVRIYTPRQALEQVRAVDLAFRSVPVVSFEAKRVDRYEKLDDSGRLQEWVAVGGVEQAGVKFLDGDVGVMRSFAMEVEV